MADQSLAGLYAALDEAPADVFTLGALADWYEEHGDAAGADCLRWALRTGRRHGLNARQTMYGKLYWEREGRDPILNDPPAQLREALWLALGGNDEKYPVGCFKSYKTARAAYEALIAAWKVVGGAVPDPGAGG